MKSIIMFVLAVSLIGCGTTKSLNKENTVPHAVVQVSDTLKITGRLLEENESNIVIAVDGVSKEYILSEIQGYEVIMLPQERLMLEEAVRNTSKTASNTGFFVILSILTMISMISLASIASK